MHRKCYNKSLKTLTLRKYKNKNKVVGGELTRFIIMEMQQNSLALHILNNWRALGLF